MREEYITKVDIPEDFLKQFLLSSFIETLKWWLHQRQKMTVEDLLKILFNYGREVNYRELGDSLISLALSEVMNGLIV